MRAYIILKEIISNNVLGFGLTVLGTILTIYSTFFAIYVYKKDKIKKREFDQIAKIVGENIDLTDKSDKIKELAKQIEELNKTINEVIPLKAKKAALQDKLDHSLIELAECYNSVLEIQNQLQVCENKDIEISDELFRKISNEIEPRYLLNEKLSRYSSILFLCSFISGVVSSIAFISIFKKFIYIAFSCVEVIYVYKIIKTYFEMKNKEMLYFITFVVEALIAVFAIIIIILVREIILDCNYIGIFFLILFIICEFITSYGLYVIKKRI